MSAEAVLFDAMFPLQAQGYCEIRGTASLGPEGDDAEVVLYVNGQAVDAVPVSDTWTYRLEWEGPLPRGEQHVQLTERSCLAGPGKAPAVSVKSFQRVPPKRP
jgi:hypothetical protein